MDKKSFYEILTTSTPEELNEMISSHGTRKYVNAITFIHPEEENNSNNKQDKDAKNTL